MSREWLALTNLVDLFVQVNSKGKPKPLERPWSASARRYDPGARVDPELKKMLLINAGRGPTDGG